MIHRPPPSRPTDENKPFFVGFVEEDHRVCSPRLSFNSTKVLGHLSVPPKERVVASLNAMSRRTGALFIGVQIYYLLFALPSASAFSFIAMGKSMHRKILLLGDRGRRRVMELLRIRLGV
eukprot:scaffold190_cov171-Amphora_coffeaeformis.AAC.21